MANSAGKFSVRLSPRSPSPVSPPIARPSLSSQESQTLQRSPFSRGFGWGVGLGLAALLSSGVGLAIALGIPGSLPSVPLVDQVLPVTAGENDAKFLRLLPYRLSRPVNILVMGVDRLLDVPPDSPEALNGRSDTMLLLRFDPVHQSMQMLSIPRDTRVEISGVGYKKINDANAQGGAVLAAQVVSETLNNVPIDRYVRVTTDAFRQIVDLMGGVEVYVPHPMVYEDKTQKLEINLAAGWQTLNGEQAEQFARFRKDQFGDIGRVQRQQILLKALQQRLYNPAMLPRIPQALKVIQEAVDTNLSLEELLALANFGLSIERENLKMVMLPGRFSQEGEFDNLSYWIMSETGRDRVMASYFDQISATESEVELSHNQRSLRRLRIAIQNATDRPDASTILGEQLRQAGFRNVYTIKDSTQLIGATAIVAQRGDLEAAATLQSLLGIGRVEADSTGDLESDLTIRIGLDSENLNLDELAVPSLAQP